jgi:hypothetical protein
MVACLDCRHAELMVDKQKRKSAANGRTLSHPKQIGQSEEEVGR